jgi:excisionase family DNA binding protein
MGTAEQLRTVAQVAKDLQVSELTVRRRVWDGSLVAFRVGRHGPLRIPQRAVDELLQPTRGS